MIPGEALSKCESALKYNTEDWYIQVDLIDSIAACMMMNGQQMKVFRNSHGYYGL